MLTFSQFLAEDIDSHKGWMSPSGSAHHFKGEHYLDHHPAIAAKVKKGLMSHDHEDYNPTDAITKAQKMGYTRYARHGDSHMIHYDKDAKGGKESALHALKHLAPSGPVHIVVRNRPFGYGSEPGKRLRGDRHDSTFTKASEAAHHIRNS